MYWEVAEGPGGPAAPTLPSLFLPGGAERCPPARGSPARLGSARLAGPRAALRRPPAPPRAAGGGGQPRPPPPAPRAPSAPRLGEEKKKKEKEREGEERASAAGRAGGGGCRGAVGELRRAGEGGGAPAVRCRGGGSSPRPPRGCPGAAAAPVPSPRGGRGRQGGCGQDPRRKKPDPAGPGPARGAPPWFPPSPPERLRAAPGPGDPSRPRVCARTRRLLCLGRFPSF